ncbi:MAG: MFS transporter [Patescibacteria group bacterium]|nr:MFS transporter [Patescibacteria group bacterium]
MSKNNVNKIIRGLIVSDFFLFFSTGLLAPIFAVFVLHNVENKIEVIGYAVSIYWLVRVITVIPFSSLMDKLKGEMDEYYFMIIGTLITSCVPLFYIFSNAPWHIYLVQIISGLANSMAVPAWRILFTNHIDSRIIGFEWSLEDVGVGVATAVSASLGAFIADRFGFDILFVAITVCGLIGTFILLPLSQNKRAVIKMLFRHRKGDKAPFKIDDIK